MIYTFKYIYTYIHMYTYLSIYLSIYLYLLYIYIYIYIFIYIYKNISSYKNVQKLLWVWYLDDIFCIWTDGLEKLNELFSYLSSFHPTIKFTMNYSDTNNNFLDVYVTKNSAKLSTDLFTKEADFHQYLHETSCHR